MTSEALIPVLASIVLTAANLWYQSYQEARRAARSTSEREANRSERLHEHWLDTKISIYREFLARAGLAHRRVVERRDPYKQLFDEASGEVLLPAWPQAEDQAAREALTELELVAPKQVSDRARQYLILSTLHVDLLYGEMDAAAASGDDARLSAARDRFIRNEEEVEFAKTRFRDLVRRELALEALETPSKHQTSAFKMP